jgi:hypothetical protein
MTGSDNHSPGYAKRIALAQRTSGGIRVTLLWAAETNAVAVHVHDASVNDQFELDVAPGANPIDVFEHPYAYAAWQGIDYASTDLRRAA